MGKHLGRGPRGAQKETVEVAARAYGELLELEENLGRELYLGSSIELLLGRGVALLRLEDFDAAELAFWAAWRRSDDSLELALLLGQAMYLGDQKEAAAAIFRQLEARFQPADEARFWIAVTYASLRGDGEAFAWFSRVESPPQHHGFYLQLGRARLGDLWRRGAFEDPEKKDRHPWRSGGSSRWRSRR